MDVNRTHPAHVAHEPTPPTSSHPDQLSPRAPFEQSPPGNSPNVAAAIVTTEPVCMYIDDCDTDSPQRKAISHIFGRNKMCTRMIPEHLWVHLCRKHYQRCRYRDQDKWAKAQCDLVQIQIRRIHEWSMTNQINGSGIRLQNWTLTMRKREKMRRMKLAQDTGAIKRKRGASSQDDDDAGDREESGYPSTTTKVPDWLVDHCDKEFSTAGILVVFNRLHQDILDGRVGPHFPDLELLPNLLTPEGNEKKPTKPAAKATPRKTHQRSQSLQTPSSIHESPFRDSATKRRRPNEEFSFERGLQPAMQQPSYLQRLNEQPSFEHNLQPTMRQSIYRQRPNEEPPFERGLQPASRPSPPRQRVSEELLFDRGLQPAMRQSSYRQHANEEPLFDRGLQPAIRQNSYRQNVNEELSFNHGLQPGMRQPSYRQSPSEEPLFDRGGPQPAMRNSAYRQSAYRPTHPSISEHEAISMAGGNYFGSYASR